MLDSPNRYLIVNPFLLPVILIFLSSPIPERPKAPVRFLRQRLCSNYSFSYCQLQEISKIQASNCTKFALFSLFMSHVIRFFPAKTKKHVNSSRINVLFLVGVARLELAASCSQSRRATNCATPRKNEYYHTIPFFCAFVKCAECRNLPGAPKTTLTLYFCLEAEPKMVYYKVY